MAVVSRPPAAAGQQQHRKAQQARAGRSSGVLYGSELDGSGMALHHKEWNARARSSNHNTSSTNMSRSGRSDTNVTYHVDFNGGSSFGSWCGGCMTRSGAMSPPPRAPKSSKLGSGEVKLSSGDIGSLVKNFSGGFERSTPGSSPALRPRMSPGKVSPLVEAVPPPATLAAPAPAVQAPAVFSMGSFTKMSSNSSSSPPVEKIKASPTLFEMMSHEQEMQGVKTVHSLSLSQQLTFQEKMKTILAGLFLTHNPFMAVAARELSFTLVRNYRCCCFHGSHARCFH